MLDKIKSFFKKDKNEAVMDSKELKRRQQLNAELNHPDDNFINDDFLEEEEMRLINEKKYRKGNFRTGYYIFGFVFAAVLIGIAIFNLFKAADYDIMIMVQDDGFITEAEIELISQTVIPHVPDKNNDGEIKIEVVTISLPIKRTDANEGIYQLAIDEMNKELVPHYISIVFGRENFIEEVEEIRPIKEKVMLSEVIAPIEEESALNEYYMAVRSTERKGDKYSPAGIEIFENITK